MILSSLRCCVVGFEAWGGTMKTRDALIAAALGIIVSGCCRDDVGLVLLSFEPEAKYYYAYVWPGDTVTVYASADRASGTFCPPELYNSRTAANRFRFGATDTAVATISSEGLLTARIVGFVNLVATSEGFSDTQRISVSPAIASLRITARPTPAHVGDTITVHADAVDGSGNIVPGAQLDGFELLPFRDTVARWLPNTYSLPFYPWPARAAPLVDRLVAQYPGTITIRASAPHYGRPFFFLADTITLTVAP
jgi:hypothetical protein